METDAINATKETNGTEYKKNDGSSPANIPPKSGFNAKLAFAIAAAAIGSSFQHGYNTGVINNPQKVLEMWISTILTNRTETEDSLSAETITNIWSIIVAIFCAGGMIGGLCTGFVAERLGRKGALLWNNVLVLLCALLFLFAKYMNSYELLIAGRFFIGVNSGLNAGLVPMYLSEIAPVHLRGAVGTIYQLVITVSILIAQVFSLHSVMGTADLWHILLAITVVPALFQVITLPLCPESPRYLLVTKGDDTTAQKALSWLRGTLGVHEEMDALRSENDSLKIMAKVSLREMFTNHMLRIPLIISLMVMLAQQFSGVNAVFFFSTNIFLMAGLSSKSATYATVAIGLINVVMTVISMFLVEKAGRRTLLLWGFIGMTISTALLTVGLIFAEDVPILSYACIVLILAYVVMFAVGPGPIPWFLVTELFGQSARPLASSLAVGVNWAANFVVGLAFLPIKNAIQSYVFVIFVVLQVLFSVFIYKKVPETKNKTVEEISTMFRQQSYEK